MYVHVRTCNCYICGLYGCYTGCYTGCYMLTITGFLALRAYSRLSVHRMPHVAHHNAVAIVTKEPVICELAEQPSAAARTATAAC
ncbi:hypothetical protein HaLaN_13217, partial [Haematococcus lacustris]